MLDKKDLEIMRLKEEVKALEEFSAKEIKRLRGWCDFYSCECDMWRLRAIELGHKEEEETQNEQE